MTGEGPGGAERCVRAARTQSSPRRMTSEGPGGAERCVRAARTRSGPRRMTSEGSGGAERCVRAARTRSGPRRMTEAGTRAIQIGLAARTRFGGLEKLVGVHRELVMRSAVLRIELDGALPFDGSLTLLAALGVDRSELEVRSGV